MSVAKMWRDWVSGGLPQEVLVTERGYLDLARAVDSIEASIATLRTVRSCLPELGENSEAQVDRIILCLSSRREELQVLLGRLRVKLEAGR